MSITTFFIVNDVCGYIFNLAVINKKLKERNLKSEIKVSLAYFISYTNNQWSWFWTSHSAIREKITKRGEHVRGKVNNICTNILITAVLFFCSPRHIPKRSSSSQFSKTLSDNNRLQVINSHILHGFCSHMYVCADDY